MSKSVVDQYLHQGMQLDAVSHLLGPSDSLSNDEHPMQKAVSYYLGMDGNWECKLVLYFEDDRPQSYGVHRSSVKVW